MARDQPRVSVFATGGTIQNPTDREGFMSGTELVEAIPGLESVASLEVHEISEIPSENVTPEIWFELGESIQETVDTGSVDGIVVTSGSNAVEETAYFLNLALSGETPVVATAAQRERGTVGHDGDRNFLDAVRVAAHPDSGGLGTLVVVNEEIHHAREVTKTVSSRPDGWSSGNVGVLGLVDEHGRIQYYRESTRESMPSAEFTLDVTDPTDLPDIEVVYSTANAGGDHVAMAIEKDVDGLVVDAFPTGVPAAPEGRDGQATALQRAIDQDIPTVLVQRGSEGWPSWDDTYLEDGPYIWGDTLTPQKAKILLALALNETDDYDEVQSFFTTY